MGVGLLERLEDEPQRLFCAAPREGDARAAVPVIVDARRAGGRVLEFEANLGAAGPEPDLVLEHLGHREARLEGIAAPQDPGGGGRIRLRVPPTFFCGAAEVPVLGARDHIGNLRGILVV